MNFISLLDTFPVFYVRSLQSERQNTICHVIENFRQYNKGGLYTAIWSSSTSKRFYFMLHARKIHQLIC